MRQIYAVYKTEAEAKTALHKMVASGEINEMEFPFVARRCQPIMGKEQSSVPWAIWISP